MLISYYANKKSSPRLPSWQPSLISLNTPIDSGSIIKPCTLKHFQVPILAPGLVPKSETNKFSGGLATFWEFSYHSIIKLVIIQEFFCSFDYLSLNTASNWSNIMVIAHTIWVMNWHNDTNKANDYQQSTVYLSNKPVPNKVNIFANWGQWLFFP